MRALATAMLLLFAAAPAAAFAGEAIPTASSSPSPLPAAAPVSPLAEVGDEAAAAGPDARRLGPCGPEAVAADGSAETKAHGYAEVGVGTGGYRHVAAGFCKPFKNGGAVAVTVSQSQVDGPRFRDH